MRFLKTSLIIAAALALAACSGKSSSNSSDQTNAAASAAATEAASPAASAAASAAADEIPSYPGATTAASGSGSNMGQTESGSVLMTDDSFDKVYAWYQQHMPAGSEKSHVTAPIESAVFTLGSAPDVSSATITAQGGKTMITIGKVKQQ
jgi:Spy/CpxP family protein refolding chaperone